MQLSDIIPAKFPSLTQIGATFASAVAIISALTFFGVGISPPWASAAEVKTINDRLDKMLQHQETMDHTLLILQRDYYRRQLANAEADLKKNPDSEPAAGQRDEARAWIEYINKQLAPSSP